MPANSPIAGLPVAGTPSTLIEGSAFGSLGLAGSASGTIILPEVQPVKVSNVPARFKRPIPARIGNAIGYLFLTGFASGVQVNAGRIAGRLEIRGGAFGVVAERGVASGFLAISGRAEGFVKMPVMAGIAAGALGMTGKAKGMNWRAYDEELLLLVA